MFWRGLASATVFGLGVAVGMMPAGANATTFDLSTVPGPDPLATSVNLTVGGITITAQGWNYGTNTSPVGIAGTASNLWVRTGAGDRGLGVCSAPEGTSSCTSNGGDVNEITNEASNVHEGVSLLRPTGQLWTSLFVSSLDSGGTNSSEHGILYWANSLSTFTATNSYKFDYSLGACSGSSVECDILATGNFTSSGGTFDPAAKYVLFMNDPANGTNGIGNNDFLVWKAVTVQGPPGLDPLPAPEPASLALMGVGLLGLGMVARRRT